MALYKTVFLAVSKFMALVVEKIVKTGNSLPHNLSVHVYIRGSQLV